MKRTLALCLTLLLTSVSIGNAKPPQAPRPPQAPPIRDVGVCGVGGCPCGCTEGLPCTCAAKAKDAAKWKAKADAKHDKLLSDGWTYSVNDRHYYWYKQGTDDITVDQTPALYVAPITYQPQQMQFYQPQMFNYGGYGGGGYSGFGGGSCGPGGCR